MKVVFVASHSQKKELGEFYQRINAVLKSHDYKIYAGTLFDEKDTNELEEDQKEREKRYKESLDNVRIADMVVVEMSYPSTANVGHLLTYALDMGKPVVVLYKSGRDPFFLRGRVDDKLAMVSYTTYDLEQVLQSALDYANASQDVRFNFFISPEIGHYLDWISKNKRIPRAVYLRKLIEEDMRETDEYKKSE